MVNKVNANLKRFTLKLGTNSGICKDTLSTLALMQILDYRYLLGVIWCCITIAGCSEKPDLDTDSVNIDTTVNVNSKLSNTQKLTNEIDTLAIDLPISCRNSDIVTAFNKKQSGVKVKGCGQVQSILDDGYNIPKHQRFIVKLEDIEPELWVTVWHNIDVSPRVRNLQQGTDVVFYGQYDYDENGGIISQTHRDFTSQHQRGWIELNTERFQ